MNLEFAVRIKTSTNVKTYHALQSPIEQGVPNPWAKDQYQSMAC